MDPGVPRRRWSTWAARAGITLVLFSSIGRWAQAAPKPNRLVALHEARAWLSIAECEPTEERGRQLWRLGVVDERIPAWAMLARGTGRESPPSWVPTGTYGHAIKILELEAVLSAEPNREAEDRRRILRLISRSVGELEASRIAIQGGGRIWGYERHSTQAELPASFFALLSLRAARRVGVAVSESTWAEALVGLLQLAGPVGSPVRAQDGVLPVGFGYIAKHDITPQRTSLGLWSVRACLASIGSRETSLAPSTRERAVRVIRGARIYLEDGFAEATLEKVRGSGKGRGWTASFCAFSYVVWRAMTTKASEMLEDEEIVRLHEAVIRTRSSDGSWGGRSCITTAFMILTLDVEQVAAWTSLE